MVCAVSHAGGHLESERTINNMHRLSKDYLIIYASIGFEGEPRSDGIFQCAILLPPKSERS